MKKEKEFLGIGWSIAKGLTNFGQRRAVTHQKTKAATLVAGVVLIPLRIAKKFRTRKSENIIKY